LRIAKEWQKAKTRDDVVGRYSLSGGRGVPLAGAPPYSMLGAFTQRRQIMAKPIPDGYHTVTPYLSMSDASKAIAFYREALGATELVRMPMPNGRIGHAELQIGNSRIMLADEALEWGNKSAKTMGGTPVVLCIYDENVEALAARFVKAGGKVLKPLANQFYGDRSGQFEDPEGYKWTLAQHVEDVSPEEMKRRMAKAG
jgi:PhnB protein